ncbi:TPA: hypothetical protein ACH3X1_003806 [Trebouxia sp. C0004]
MVNATVTASVSCRNWSHSVLKRQQHHGISTCYTVRRRTTYVPAIMQATHMQHAQQSVDDKRQSSSIARDTSRVSVRLIRCDNVCPLDKHRFGCLPQLAVRLVEALAALVLVGQPSPAMAGEIIQGMPRVADGDTLQIDEKKIRLFGFDAPEKAQLCKNAQGADYSCGLQSGEALHSMIGSNSVRCEVRNKDQYGRNVSSCSVLTNKGPVDIGNFMVSNGYAVAYRQYGKDYIALEDAAHQAHKGMWQGSFEMPADWRKDQKIDKLLEQRGRSLQPQASNAALPQIASSTSPSSSQDGPANGCKIKGNINSKGEKIYHVPGGRYYDSTQIDLPQGERWFCTERQAKDAGWRASQ